MINEKKKITEAEQIEEAKNQEVQRIRASALVLAEYHHKNDVDVKPILDKVKAVFEHLKNLEQEMIKAKEEFNKFRKELELKLESHIQEEELQTLTNEEALKDK